MAVLAADSSVDAAAVSPVKIAVRDVSKSFGGRVVLDDISLDIRQGEFVVLIGPSGGGKTTLLRLLNRLAEPDEGHVFMDGRDIARIPGADLRSRMGYVIQGGGLFPHLTVRRNIDIMMRNAGVDKAEAAAKVDRLMDMVDLDRTLADAYPCQLSGGQQQRVGVAHAFAMDPGVILMDEPFSALDPLTRQDLQDQLLELHRESGKTFVFVTHDMDEAVRLADRICVIQHGKVVQFDAPSHILAHPVSDFVVRFIGRARSISDALVQGSDAA